jgi:type IV secretion system protein VirB9
MLMRKLTCAALVLTACATAYAVDIPMPGPDDTRIRVVNYRAQDVTLIKVKRGVVTRITLAPDEKIEVTVAGLSSRCDNDADEWCISSIKGSNQIFVRPRDNARRNNVELHTDKRDYSFEFEVLSDASVYAKKGRAVEYTSPAYYRVVFNYPKPVAATPSPTVVSAAALSSASTRAANERAEKVASILQALDAAPASLPVDPDANMRPVDLLKAEPITVRNANYSKQVLHQGADADPTLVFDDGRFTYFEFLGAREIPAIFAYGSDDAPTRVNWHMQPPFVVVQRTARKFTLRLGGAVVGVFNEQFDATGVNTPGATVSPAVRRELKD